jgi:uncharacterized cupin superfamily protein
MLEFSDQPYDEFVYVLQGSCVLTAKGGQPRTFEVGDFFIVPKGFTGTWEVRGNYRELIVIETKTYTETMEKWFPSSE